MEKESELSSKYDSGKLLIQTFGRGKLSRYLEPNFSERNNFEREKMSKEQPTRNMSHNKKGQTFKDKLLALDKQNDKQSNHEKSQFKQAPFEQIDEISQKINGIIRSISLSYQKRGINSSSKKTLDKCETVDRLHKLQNKYCNHASEKQFKAIDQKSIPLFKQQVMKKSQTRENSSKNEVQLSSFSKKSVKKYHEPSQSSHNQEQYDDINQRIQYINEKITRYEHKMAGYQETYQTNKKVNEMYFKDIKEENRTKEFILKSSSMNIYTQSAREKESKTKQRGKENTYFDKEGKLLSSRKQGFFNEKYQQLLNSSKNDQKHKELHESFRKVDGQKKEKIAKSSKDSRILLMKKNPLHSKFEENLKIKTSFLKSLIKQIALDQDFRHAKHMFGGVQLFDEKSESESQKWFRLQQQLESEGISLSIHEVKHIFMPRDDEIDPFMSVSQSHEELVFGVVYAYQTCEQHWKEMIYHGWSFRELKESNFTSENIDRGKKGYISLQDLTFYINTQIDGFFRNRDLLLIFNRLGSKHNLKYKQIIDFLLTS